MFILLPINGCDINKILTERNQKEVKERVCVTPKWLLGSHVLLCQPWLRTYGI
jgi:hypothetical protein